MSDSPKTREEKIAEARLRFGKPFLLEPRMPRRTGKSAFLRRLERRQAEARAAAADAAAEAAGKVRAIRRKEGAK
ncbi:MAG: hypothetical protein HYU77_13685 [Betaproteobacteria bacterium]|nr:hypothetical protein [Betaproteobacteria bacterium]